MLYIIIFFSAFALAAIVTPAVKYLAIKLDILDYPNKARKIHNQPTPLLGGLAIFITFIIIFFILWSNGLIIDNKISNTYILGILSGSIFIMIGGFLDDKYNLSPKYQFIFPLLAALMVIFCGIKIAFITNPFGGVFSIPMILGVVLTFFWLLGMMYTTKFLDGLDGLATGISLIGSIIIFIVSLFWDDPSSGTSAASLIVAGACLGFLLYNFYPAKIFLGEGGSVFLGFILGVLSVISGSKIATTLLIMGIPILDAGLVLFKRFKEKKSLFSGDKKHLHFKLLNKGFNQRQAVIFLYVITGFFGFMSLLLKTQGKIISLTILVISVLVFFKFLSSDYKFKAFKK